VIKKKEICLSEYRNTAGARHQLRRFIDEVYPSKTSTHHWARLPFNQRNSRRSGLRTENY
jgi:hypothetical protein